MLPVTPNAQCQRLHRKIALLATIGSIGTLSLLLLPTDTGTWIVTFFDPLSKSLPALPPPDTGTWILTGLCAIAVMAHWGARAYYWKMVPPRGLFKRLALPLLGVAILLAASPEIVRRIEGWPLNLSADPPIVGPGDSTRVDMNERIRSLKGLWRGDTEVSLSVADGPALSTGIKVLRDTPVRATTAKGSWGTELEWDYETSTPWVQIKIPAEAALAGKTVTCNIKLSVTYPSYNRGNTGLFFEDVTQESVAQSFPESCPGRRARILQFRVVARIARRCSTFADLRRDSGKPLTGRVQERSHRPQLGVKKPTAFTACS